MTQGTIKPLGIVVAHAIFLLVFWGSVFLPPAFRDVYETMGAYLTSVGELIFRRQIISYLLGITSFLSLATVLWSYAKYRSLTPISSFFFQLAIATNLVCAGLLFHAMFSGSLPYWEGSIY